MFSVHFYEWINTPSLLYLKYVIKISIMHVMHWGKHGETWKKLLCFPENDENFLNTLIKGCKQLKCGNLHNNASVSEPDENL